LTLKKTLRRLDSLLILPPLPPHSFWMEVSFFFRIPLRRLPFFPFAMTMSLHVPRSKFDGHPPPHLPSGGNTFVWLLFAGSVRLVFRMFFRNLGLWFTVLDSSPLVFRQTEFCIRFLTPPPLFVYHPPPAAPKACIESFFPFSDSFTLPLILSTTVLSAFYHRPLTSYSFPPPFFFEPSPPRKFPWRFF